MMYRNNELDLRTHGRLWKYSDTDEIVLSSEADVRYRLGCGLCPVAGRFST